MTDTPQVLLAHHLKTLKLPTFLREYDKIARQCASEGVDHVRYLLRLAELELIDRERRMVELNRPRFTGERLVQILGCFFMCVQGFIEHLLCFVRRDISDGAVKTLGVVPIDPFQRFPFKLAH